MTLILLSAPSTLGKTTACARLLALAREQGFHTEGFLSPPVFKGNEKTAIYLQNAATGEKRLFARKALPHETPDIGHWHMDPDATMWANRAFSTLPPADLLFVDEIGPLELVHHRGLTEGLRAVESTVYRLGIITIRPSLLEILQTRLEHLTPIPFVLNTENRDEAPHNLLQYLMRSE